MLKCLVILKILHVVSLSLSLSLSLSQPLSRELAQSTEEVQQLGSKVTKLQFQVNLLKGEQEKLLQGEDHTSSITDNHAPLIQSPAAEPEEMLLIDLNEPHDNHVTFLPPVDKPLSESHDLLGPSMETSDLSGLECDVLQPEVLTESQSQELF